MITIDKPQIYKHNKTGNLYFAINENVIDCTNSSNQREMVLYRKINNFTTKDWYIRDKKEFLSKFTSINL